MMGDREKALADLEKSQEIDAKNPYIYKMRGEIYSEMGEKEAALAAYKEYWKQAPNASDIPDEYMQEVDAAAYDKTVKEREKKEQEKKEKEAAKKGTPENKMGEKP